MKKKFLGFLFLIIAFSIFNHAEASYERLNKNSKAYYYTQSKPYWEGQTRHWDQNAYRSFYYYDHDVYPQYTYTYPGHYSYYGYPYYYNNDNGRIYFYWGY